MGSVSGPLDVAALRDRFSVLPQEGPDPGVEAALGDEEGYPWDWRRML